MAAAIQLRISRRARYLRIDVSAHRGVVVVVPEGTPRAVVQRFVMGRRRWIRDARERVARRAEERAATGPALPARLELEALGETYPVVMAADGRRGVRCSGGQLRVSGAADPAAGRAALVRWLKARGRETLVPWLARHAREHGLRYRRTMVRGQRTRWGSCSGRGTISLNYKLLFLPPQLVDHVLLHELAHTRHLNHSARFWRLLAELDPNWRAHHAALARAERWLPYWLELADAEASAGR